MYSHSFKLGQIPHKSVLSDENSKLINCVEEYYLYKKKYKTHKKTPFIFNTFSSKIYWSLKKQNKHILIVLKFTFITQFYVFKIAVKFLCSKGNVNLILNANCIKLFYENIFLVKNKYSKGILKKTYVELDLSRK